ncbi:hypothetical protein N9292_00020 [Akkermansiaceae bacterium]|nr:hypothetical protein [Akkermansiaceae bacterium]
MGHKLEGWHTIDKEKAINETFYSGDAEKQFEAIRHYIDYSYDSNLNPDGKELEGTYKDGKWEGLWTGWHDNGQKMFEGTYKKGKKVSAKYWNIEGIEVENLDEAGWRR